MMTNASNHGSINSKLNFVVKVIFERVIQSLFKKINFVLKPKEKLSREIFRIPNLNYSKSEQSETQYDFSM